MTVRILYELGSGVPDVREQLTEKRKEEINVASGIELEITYLRIKDRKDFYRRLFENPNGYDIAIVHLSGANTYNVQKDSFAFAEEIRRRTDFSGKLVAESSAFGYDERTILQYFDHSTDVLTYSNNFVRFLIELGYLPEDFHLS